MCSTPTDERYFFSLRNLLKAFNLPAPKGQRNFERIDWKQGKDFYKTRTKGTSITEIHRIRFEQRLHRLYRLSITYYYYYLNYDFCNHVILSFLHQSQLNSHGLSISRRKLAIYHVRTTILFSFYYFFIFFFYLFCCAAVQRGVLKQSNIVKWLNLI